MTFDLEVSDQVAARSKIEAQAAALEVANREGQRAQAIAETATRAKDEFLAMLGHELRNPLSPILTALQLLRMRGVETREQAVIERQVGHLLRLVDDLLDISRITRGKIELQRQPMEFGAAVASGIEMARPLLEQRRQRLNLSVPADGLLVDGDLNRLAQIVANLLTNAAKYSDPDSTVTITAERSGPMVRLAVRDQGVGIPPDLLGRVFDIFFQQSQSIDRSKGGLGLGLAIVRNLVELHGGRVSAHSDGVGRGSEFVVELPALAGADEAPETGARSLVRRGDELPVVAAAKRVLIVDDNVDAGEALAEMLELMGYEVKTAHDAFAALELAPLFKPDICLLDIGLPVMDGYKLAARLRSDSLVGDQTRIIAVTGYGQDGDRRRAREAGFDAHVVKPVSLDALVRAME
jgi:CheY-like chemotaxis protein